MSRFLTMRRLAAGPSTRFVVAAFALLCITCAGAGEAQERVREPRASQRGPDLTLGAFKGRWESLVLWNSRAWVIEAHGDGTCRVSMSVWLETWLFECTSLTVRADGSFDLRAQDPSKVVLRIRGNGWYIPGSFEGELRARVDVGRGPDATSFRDVVFQNRSDGYFERLRSTMTAAQRALDAGP